MGSYLLAGTAKQEANCQHLQNFFDLIRKIIKTHNFAEENILLHKNKIHKAYQLKRELSMILNV